MAQKQYSTARFRDTAGTLHEVQLIADRALPAIALSGAPFVTTMDNSDGIIYRPARYSGATVGLIAASTEDSAGKWTHNTYEGLFTPTAQGTAVKLVKPSNADYDARVEGAGHTQLTNVSTDGSYIDMPTLTSCTPDTDIVLEFSLNSMPDGWAGLLGAKDGYSIDGTSYGIFINGSGSFMRLDWCGENITAPITTGVVYRLHCHGSTVEIDGVKYGGNVNKTTLNKTPFLGGVNQGDFEGADITIYAVEVNGVRYVPAAIYGGEAGLYAPATNTNVTTDEWTGGEEITAAVEWCGYATPNTYTQPFAAMVEELQLEAIDGLATLQYYKYTDVMWRNGTTSTDGVTKEVRRLLDIVGALLYRCGCYKYFYVSDAVQLATAGTDGVLALLWVSECNFFASDGDTDRDRAWACNDVLEAICRYLGYSAVAYGDSVYLLDYDAIKAGYNYYHRYMVVAPNAAGKYPLAGARVMLTATHEVTAADSASADTSITLDKTYNKITVVDKLNTYDYAVPSIFDGGRNVTSVGELPDIPAQNASLEATKRTAYGSGDSRGEFIHYPYSDDQKRRYAVWQQWWAADGWTFNIYTLDQAQFNTAGTLIKRGEVGKMTSPLFDFSSVDYSTAVNNIGAFPVRSMVKTTDDSDVDALDTSTATLNYTDYIMMPWHDTTQRTAIKSWTSGRDESGYLIENSNPSPRHNVMFSTPATGKNAAFMGGKNNYLLITGSVIIQDREHYFPDTYSVSKSTSNNIYGDRCYFDVQVKCGGYYYNPYKTQNDDGSYTGGWQTSARWFALPFMLPKESKPVAEVMGQPLKICNNVNWRAGLDEEGFAIPLATLPTLADTVQLIVGNPYGYSVAYDNGTDSGTAFFKYKTQVVLLQDFAVKAKTAGSETDTDTSYSIITDDSYTEALDDIEFKLCTWDDKKPNYSCVCWRGADGYKYLDRCYCLPLMGDDLLSSSTIWDNSAATAGLRLESWHVYRCYKQYRGTGFVVAETLHTALQPWALVTQRSLPDKSFVVDSFAIDYRLNSITYNLIEKK